ncbi:MAG: LutB/LldF family L-lactate oxidation iron-sulfur protein [Chloroflexota bacterium]
MSNSTIDLYAPYQQRVDTALGNKSMRVAVNRTVSNLANNRNSALEAIDGDTLRGQLRQMKEYVLRHWPELLEQLEERVTENGGHVHWAENGEEAAQIVQRLAAQNGVKTAVKSKSMVTEEIHLNQALEQIGVRPIETDLGEYIIQLANEPPSHIIAPVIHKRIEDVSQIFQKELDLPPTLDAQMMCGAARSELRKEFLGAEMGISGCNFAIAETGQICIVTNEGNGRMVSSMPKVYVAVMGIEKLVPTVEDAFLQYQLLCRSATGQQSSVYLSMTGGPRRDGDIDGPDEFHVILLDNGRTDMLEKGYGEALMCVRCGACLNVCPVYREIGGHAYGSTYSGPIGAVVSPLLHTQVTDSGQLPHASTLCGACREVCPVQIDLPKLLLDLRADSVEQGTTPAFEKRAIKGFVQAMSSRNRYVTAGKMASITTGVMAGLAGGNIKFAPPPLSGWTTSRTLPPFARQSFRSQWAERQRRRRRVSGATPQPVPLGNPDRPSAFAASSSPLPVPPLPPSSTAPAASAANSARPNAAGEQENASSPGQSSLTSEAEQVNE